MYTYNQTCPHPKHFKAPSSQAHVAAQEECQAALLGGCNYVPTQSDKTTKDSL